MSSFSPRWLHNGYGEAFELVKGNGGSEFVAHKLKVLDSDDEGLDDLSLKRLSRRVLKLFLHPKWRPWRCSKSERGVLRWRPRWQGCAPRRRGGSTRNEGQFPVEL